jgi:hypothetical protein
MSGMTARGKLDYHVQTGPGSIQHLAPNAVVVPVQRKAQTAPLIPTLVVCDSRRGFPDAALI